VKPTIRADRLLKGLEALRSDRFTQGRGKLRRQDTADGIVKHCCLGVLTEIALEDPEFVVCDTDAQGAALMVLDYASSVAEIIWTVNSNTLSYSVRDYYGLPDDDPQLEELLSEDHEEHECGGPGNCPYEDSYSASNANDDLRWTFNEIADAFERTYLQNQETENAA
jgi:hypothetical protein